MIAPCARLGTIKLVRRLLPRFASLALNIQGESVLLRQMAEQSLTGYLAAPDQLAEMLAELGGKPELHGHLALVAGHARPIAWAQNVWLDPRALTISSIAEGARALRNIQRNWTLYPGKLHRRASLIAERLPHVSAKPLKFPATGTHRAARLLDPARCQHDPGLAPLLQPVPQWRGPLRRRPQRSAQPRLSQIMGGADARRQHAGGRMPGPGDLCLDLGSSPGGWSWVLQKLGARVISVDKAPLDPAIASLPGIDYRQMSAFALEPAAIGPVDWLFSDVICYPARLLRLVETWLASGLVRNFICTLKFQGKTDMQTAQRFAAIPGSRLTHLFHNKHELTWIQACR